MRAGVDVYERRGVGDDVERGVGREVGDRIDRIDRINRINRINRIERAAAKRRFCSI